jgi:hypothetical protein
VDTITSIVAYLSSSEEDLAQESTQVMYIEYRITSFDAPRNLLMGMAQLFDAFNSPKLEFDERAKTYRM